jgi:TetR/AcrR family transcriptional repressor of nem operon
MKYFVSAIRDAHAQGLIVAPDPETKAKALFACYHGTLAQARIKNCLESVRTFKHVAMDILGAKLAGASST